MTNQEKIKVLVVDDSMIFREVIARGLSSDPAIKIVGKAHDALDAIDLILKYSPDVMLCDIEMPKVNGIDFIRNLLPKYSLPVIVVSSISEAVFEAMKAGAVDFVVKPNLESVGTVEDFLYDLIAEVKIAAVSNVSMKRHKFFSPKTVEKVKVSHDQIIAIGSSTGGTEAVYHILKNLPNSCPGIVIVQHIPPIFSKMFAERLNEQTEFQCKEAQDGDLVDIGQVLIAPGDHHMRIVKVRDRYKVQIFKGDKVNGHCPSVDVLFESVANEAGNKAVGVILTGMGYDGAKGLLSMRRKGAHTIGQDENSSIVYGMPKVSFNIGAVEKQASLENISQLIYSML
ncbi:MAG: chemotaxis response regulator protein-glutamate methylesterase [Bacillota bacterium]|nr:chemotaxis response regulator protein-glutamate methylesterase [Bacillota bacterium]